MAISSSSSSSSSDSEVQNCSKQCLDSFKTLEKNYGTEREKHNKEKLEIRGYEIALESLESRILGHEKNELAWGEKYEFQNYELKCREIKINNLNLELEKVVKERNELKDKIAKWEESSKNLDEILNSQISARDKTGLGYNTQLNELSSNHETDSDNSFSVFDGRSSDEESTLTNNRSSKADRYKAVPPPITGNFLTPRADISFTGLDEYDIRNKIIESQTTELNTKTSKTVDDEEEGYEMQTVRPETQTVKTRDDKSGQTSKKQGIGFKKVKGRANYTARLVCTARPSISTARPVCTTRPSISTVRPSISIARPVCTARPSISTARPICTARPSISTARPSISTDRPACTARPSISTARPSISTARPVCTARPSISTARPVYASRPIYPRMDNVRPRGSCSPIKRSYYTKPTFRSKDLKQDVKNFGVKNMTTAWKRAVINTGKGKLDTDLKKSRWVWRPKGNYLDHVSKDSGSFMLKKGNPEILLQDHAVVDSGCSSHMTGNKAYLSDYEDFNGGFVAFGSDPKREVVDFLKGTSLRYALTHNPTIYDSLVKQFWQTAIVRTLANGTQQLVASIDSKEYTITEASVRSKLQLADATGIHNLSDADIYAGLATLGYVTEGDIVPLLSAMLAGAAVDQGEGSAQPAEPHHTHVDPISSISQPPIPSPPHSPLQSPPHSPLQSPPHSLLQSPPHSPPHSPH
ncbi:hypothetical protein Tco_1229948 [Tanacetum coccineum]